MKHHLVIVRALVTERMKGDIAEYCDVNGLTHAQFFEAALSLGTSAILHLELDELRRLQPSTK